MIRLSSVDPVEEIPGGKSTPQDKTEGKHFDAGYLIQYNRYIRHQGGVNGQAAVYKK